MGVPPKLLMGNEEAHGVQAPVWGPRFGNLLQQMLPADPGRPPTLVFHQKSAGEDNLKSSLSPNVF